MNESSNYEMEELVLNYLYEKTDYHKKLILDGYLRLYGTREGLKAFLRDELGFEKTFRI